MHFTALRLAIYWLRFIHAALLVAGILTELATENPECFQERRFKAKLLWG